jgi:hypothetical protein
MLQSKYPPPKDQTTLDPTPVPPINTEHHNAILDELNSYLNHTPKRSANGPLGLRYTHWSCLQHLPGATRRFAEVVLTLFTGAAPKAATNLHRTAKLNPLEKEEHDKTYTQHKALRPIACSSTLWRIGATAITAYFSNLLREAAGTEQYGVARPGGAIALTHYLTSTLLANPSWGYISIDQGNAFNGTNPEQVARAIHNKIPDLGPYIYAWLYEPLNHVYTDANGIKHYIQKTWGLDQGCPLSAVLFPITASTVNQILARHTIVWGHIKMTHTYWARETNYLKLLSI